MGLTIEEEAPHIECRHDLTRYWILIDGSSLRVAIMELVSQATSLIDVGVVVVEKCPEAFYR